MWVVMGLRPSPRAGKPASPYTSDSIRNRVMSSTVSAATRTSAVVGLASRRRTVASIVSAVLPLQNMMHGKPNLAS